MDKKDFDELMKKVKARKAEGLDKIDPAKITYPITLEYSKDGKLWKMKMVHNATECRELLNGHKVRAPLIK